MRVWRSEQLEHSSTSIGEKHKLTEVMKSMTNILFLEISDIGSNDTMLQDASLNY